MKAGTVLLIIRDIVNDLTAAGILTATGDFSLNIAGVVGAAKTVNDTITKYGVTEPAEVQKIIAALSTIGPLL